MVLNQPLFSVLAMSMLPDGAETQLDDWTIFFLNQTSFNTISPVLALDTPEVTPIPLPGEDNGRLNAHRPELLCVLNLVRTKHDKSLDRFPLFLLYSSHSKASYLSFFRGARVLALAICTRHSFIQIFKVCTLNTLIKVKLSLASKPFLLMALDDYFADPSQDCLARLFDAVNSMDLSGAPVLTRHEKLVMRSSERKDIFAEKFSHLVSHQTRGHTPTVIGSRSVLRHRSTNSHDSYSSFEEGIMLRNKEKPQEGSRSTRKELESVQPTLPTFTQRSPSDVSFSLGGSAVWVGDESALDIIPKEKGEAASIGSLIGGSVSSRNRKSSSSSSHAHGGKEQTYRHLSQQPFLDPLLRHGVVKDTHFYHTTVAYKDHQLPIKMPLSTFPEEVGDVCDHFRHVLLLP